MPALLEAMIFGDFGDCSGVSGPERVPVGLDVLCDDLSVDFQFSMVSLEGFGGGIGGGNDIDDAVVLSKSKCD